MLWWGQMAPWLKISDERGNNRTQDVIVHYRLSATLSWSSLYPIPLSFQVPEKALWQRCWSEIQPTRCSFHPFPLSSLLGRMIGYSYIYIYTYLWIFNDIYRYIAQNGVKWRYAWLNLIHVQGFLKVGPVSNMSSWRSPLEVQRLEIAISWIWSRTYWTQIRWRKGACCSTDSAVFGCEATIEERALEGLFLAFQSPPAVSGVQN